MVREIMTDAMIANAERIAAARADKPTGRKSTMVRHTSRHARRDLDQADAIADGARAADRLEGLAEAQSARADHMTRPWDGPAAHRFIYDRPRADRYVFVLLRDLTRLDPDAGAAGRMWYDANRENLTTTQGSEWITRLKTKIASYNGQPLVTTTTPAGVVTTEPAKPAFDNYTDIPSGNYALQRDGEKTHFYRVSRSKSDGNGRVWIRVKERASDDLFPVRPWRRAVEILDAIRAMGPDASGIMFSTRLGRCRVCFKSLTDEDNGYKIYGYGPDCGPEHMGDLPGA